MSCPDVSVQLFPLQNVLHIPVWMRLPLKLETLQKLFFQASFQIPRKQENLIHQSEAGVEEVQDRDTGGDTQNKGSLSPL